jgi:hypothetical protein
MDESIKKFWEQMYSAESTDRAGFHLSPVPSTRRYQQLAGGSFWSGSGSPKCLVTPSRQLEKEAATHRLAK